MYETIIPFVILPVAGYLLGSIPFGLLIGLSRGVDVRQHGSGNIGSSNVGRILGRRWGYFCFLLDVVKGLAPTWIAGHILISTSGHGTLSHLSQLAWLLTGGACVMGHVFSLYLKFKGGKGVATSLGMVLGVWPYLTWAGLIVFAIWAIVWAIWRYISVASIVAAAFFPLTLVSLIGLIESWTFNDLWPLVAFSLIMAILVIIKHRSNIIRLLNGTENGGRRPRTVVNNPVAHN